MKMFFVAGIGIAVFIEFLLMSKKKKSGADQILTLWMFLILVHLFMFYIWLTGDVFRVPFLLGVEQPFPLLHGVFLYLYVASVTGQLPIRRKLLLLHFVPAAALYILFAAFFLLPADQKIQIYQGQRALYEPYATLLTVKLYAYNCSGILYVIWSGVLLRRHTTNIHDRFSNLNKVNLRWLQIMTFGLGGIWLLVIFFRDDTLIFSGVVVFVFLIGFFGVRQADIFTQGPVISDDSEQKEKYQKSGLTEEASGKLHQRLIQLMTENALYKRSDLSISDLSSKLGVHPNYLSQIINQKEKKNFYDFVNTYRIEEFKQLIAQQKNQQFTLLSLANDCGFSSKTSFNRYFKKVTGLTPSEYAISHSKSHS